MERPASSASARPTTPGALSLGFYGGVGTVTGSRHLLTAGRSRLLVDCGMFQGDRQLRDLNWKHPEFDPASVNALVLTHAHTDHAGLARYLPLKRCRIWRSLSSASPAV